MSVMGASRIAYRRRPTPLHAARATVAAAYGASLATAALIVGSPLMLGVLLLAVLAAAAASGVGREILRAARASLLPILVLSVVVNALISRGGLTVFARLGDWGVLGQVDLTLEAVVYGLFFALRLFVVALACLLVVCTADPDELLFSCRRISPHSALTAALATRLLPVLGEDARRLAEAQRSRPGGANGARAKLAVVRATVGGALDRSLDIAAVLEMRGYGARGRSRAASHPFSRHDLTFAASGLAILALALVISAANLAPFQTYPLVTMHLTTLGLVAAVLLFAFALLPFSDRRGIR